MNRPLKLGLALCLGLTACATERPAAPPVQANEAAFWGDHDVEREGSAGSLDLMIGVREMADDGAWSPLDSQTDLGISFQVPLIPMGSREGESLTDLVGWDFGVRYAFDDSSIAGPIPGDPSRRLEAETWDATIGLLVALGTEQSWIRPYFGGGAAIVFADVEYSRGATVARTSDTLITGYARGGLRFRFRPGQYFGLDLRWLADSGSNIDGLDAGIEALTVSFLFGASF